MLVMLLLVTGCTRQVRVEGDWAENAPHDRSFMRLLVIGLSPDIGARCDFESFMATQLRTAAVHAEPSCNLMPTSEPLTIEGVERIVAEYGADAVLTTALVRSVAGAEEGGSRETRGAGYYKATGTGYATGYYGGYGRYGVPVVYGEFRVAPVLTEVEGAVSIQTMLYAADDASLVYELTTTARDLHSRDDALAAITAPIADRLRRDGLLR